MCSPSVVIKAVEATETSMVERLTALLSHEWGEEAFLPYPRCTAAHIQRVHSFWVALPATPADNDQNENEASPSASSSHAVCKEEVYGVVGVVWVALHGIRSVSHGTPVEGYIQVVLVPPAYRRRGIAKALLSAVLSTRQTLGSHVADHNRCSGVMDLPAQICRWRLHTASPSPSTLKYLLPYYDDLVFSKESFAKDGEAEKTKIMEENLKGTVAMYTHLGFRVRATRYRYYDGAGDAVEMEHVVTVDRKRGRAE